MLNHISIGVSSLAKTKAFYDSILLPLGYRCLSEDAGAMGYGQRAVAIMASRALGRLMGPITTLPSSKTLTAIVSRLIAAPGPRPLLLRIH